MVERIEGIRINDFSNIITVCCPWLLGYSREMIEI
jgi:hypothetical protein